MDDEMCGVTKRTVGLNSLAVGVRVPYLYDAAESYECTAEKTEHNP